jgi:hypothetical protein
LTPIWFAKAETAKRVLQRVEAVFKSAILRGYRQRVSPCVGVKEELGTRHQTPLNYRALPYQARMLAHCWRTPRSAISMSIRFMWMIYNG